MSKATMSSLHDSVCKVGNVARLLTLELHHEIAEVKCSHIKVIGKPFVLFISVCASINSPLEQYIAIYRNLDGIRDIFQSPLFLHPR